MQDSTTQNNWDINSPNKPLRKPRSSKVTMAIKSLQSLIVSMERSRTIEIHFG